MLRNLIFINYWIRSATLVVMVKMIIKIQMFLQKFLHLILRLQCSSSRWCHWNPLKTQGQSKTLKWIKSLLWMEVKRKPPHGWIPVLDLGFQILLLCHLMVWFRKMTHVTVRLAISPLQHFSSGIWRKEALQRLSPLALDWGANVCLEPVTTLNV